MKFLVAFLVFFVVALISAALPYNHGDPYHPYTMSDERNAESSHRNSEVQELSAVAQLDPVTTTLLVNLGIPLTKAGIKLGYRFIKRMVCGELMAIEENVELLSQVYSGGDSTKNVVQLMSIVDAMENISTAEEKLDELNLELMKDNRIAEAELMHQVSGSVKKAMSYLRGAGKSLNKAAKKALCDN